MSEYKKQAWYVVLNSRTQDLFNDVVNAEYGELEKLRKERNDYEKWSHQLEEENEELKTYVDALADILVKQITSYPEFFDKEEYQIIVAYRKFREDK